MMRPLVMDFQNDVKAPCHHRRIYVWSAFLSHPSPPTRRTAAVSICRPRPATGTTSGRARTRRADKPLTPRRLTTRCHCSFAPRVHHSVRPGTANTTGEKPADPITLYVYADANGAFTLYEDDGLTYGYEKGAFARIPIQWDDATKTLTIGNRAGKFPGMLDKPPLQASCGMPRTNRPVFAFTRTKQSQSNRSTYLGKELKVKLN